MPSDDPKGGFKNAAEFAGAAMNGDDPRLEERSDVSEFVSAAVRGFEVQPGASRSDYDAGCDIVGMDGQLIHLPWSMPPDAKALYYALVPLGQRTPPERLSLFHPPFKWGDDHPPNPSETTHA